MKFFGKNYSVLIISNGYWRSDFLRKLLSPFCYVKRIRSHKESIPTRKEHFDFILWENDIEHPIPQWMDEGKLFLFDYRDEGNRKDLIAYSKKMGLKNSRCLLLLSKNSDVGCLPAPPPKLCKRRPPLRLENRQNDFHFLCSPTYLYLTDNEGLPFASVVDGQSVYNQRLEWATKLSQMNFLPPNQGLIKSSIEYLQKENICRIFQVENRKIFIPPLDKENYSNLLNNSKIVFCPAGHSRWTYRHIEAMFHKSLVVSTSFGKVQTLPQLPLDAFIQIEDGKFNPDEMKRIVQNIGAYQEKADQGFQFAANAFYPRNLFSRGGYRRQMKHKIFNEFIRFLENNPFRQDVLK